MKHVSSAVAIRTYPAVIAQPVMTLQRDTVAVISTGQPVKIPVVMIGVVSIVIIVIGFGVVAVVTLVFEKLVTMRS